jgi:glycosyltransferase 2 family protein
MLHKPGKTRSMRRNSGLEVLRRGAQLLALGFVVWTLWGLAKKWTGLPAGVSVRDLVLSGLILLAGNLILAWAWIRLLFAVSGQRFQLAWLMRVFLASNLGRYVPGKAALPAVRIGALGSRGVAVRIVSASMVLELISWLATAATAAFALSSWAAGDWLSAVFGDNAGWAQRTAQGLALLAVASAGVLLRLDQQRLPAALRARLGLEGAGPVLRLSVVALHGVYWLTWLAHGLLLLRGFGAGSLGASVAFVIAPVLGFLALLAPAGAGVREAVIVAMVGPMAGASNALAISLTSRLLSALADVLAWLVFAWVAPKAPDDKREPVSADGAQT